MKSGYCSSFYRVFHLSLWVLAEELVTVFVWIFISLLEGFGWELGD